MQKYYYQDVYKTGDDSLFQSHEGLIEYFRDNWKAYTGVYGENQKLVSIQDWESEIILSYSYENENGETETDEYRMDYDVIQMTWLVSELERMYVNA
jgi:hypothetical protein